MGLLKDKVALISGMGRGLGAHLARVFAREGAHIAMAARSEDTMRAVAQEIQALGRKAVWQPADVIDPAACNALAEHVESQLGRIDVLVNNAFFVSAVSPLADGDLDEWRKAMEVNFIGALTMTRAVIPVMRKQGCGRIIMVSTIGSRDIQPGAGPYASSKAALNSVTRTLARELGPDGIRVNALVPGWFLSPNAEAALRHFAEEQGTSFEEMRDTYAASTALRYLPDSEEIARVGLFLASDLSDPVTGHLLDANCGQWM